MCTQSLYFCTVLHEHMYAVSLVSHSLFSLFALALCSPPPTLISHISYEHQQLKIDLIPCDCYFGGVVERGWHQGNCARVLVQKSNESQRPHQIRPRQVNGPIHGAWNVPNGCFVDQHRDSI